MKAMAYHQAVVEKATVATDKLVATFRSCFKALEAGKPNPDYQYGLAGNWYWDESWDGELVKCLYLLASHGYEPAVPGGTWSALRKGKILVKALANTRMKRDFVYAMLEEDEAGNIIIKKIELGRQNFLWVDLNKMQKVARSKLRT